MATYREFENKLLESFSKEIVFIDLKEDKKWEINGFQWSNDVSIPVYMETLVEKIKADDIDSIPPIAILKGCVYALGTLGEDLSHYSTYVQFLSALDSAFIESIMNDGVRLADEKKWSQAILYFRVITLLCPDKIEGWYYRARAYYDLALELDQKAFFMSSEYNLNRAIALDESLGDLHYLLGYCQFELEKYKAAEQSWKRALQCPIDFEVKEELVDSLAKIDAHLKFEQGVQWILNDRVTEGVELLQILEDEHDDWWELLFYLGLGMRFQGLYEDAIGYFVKTLLLNSGEVQTMNELGLCYLAIGDLDEAEKHYKNALRLNPDHAEITCNLGIVYLNKKNIEEALAYFMEAKRLNPDDEVVNQWIEYVHQTYYN